VRSARNARTVDDLFSLRRLAFDGDDQIGDDEVGILTRSHQFI